MQLKPINNSVTKRLKLLMQARIGLYLFACVGLMLACGLYHYWAMSQGIVLDPVINAMLALIPSALALLSIPAIDWLYKGFRVRLTQSFYVKRHNVSRPMRPEQRPSSLDRPPRGYGERRGIRRR